MIEKIAARFESLSELHQEQAREKFEDASPRDGYRYQNFNDHGFSPEGNITIRHYVANAV